MKTIQLTNEQYEALMQGQSITIEPPKSEKWKPKGGIFTVLPKGEVGEYLSYTPVREFGLEYSTKEAAEKACDAMRTHNRLLAWLAENSLLEDVDKEHYLNCLIQALVPMQHIRKVREGLEHGYLEF